MPFETAILSGEPYELRVTTFGGTVVSRHSAATFVDGRYMFILGMTETPAECADVIPGGTTFVKGHAVTEDGYYDILSGDCCYCKRKAGMHVRPGKETQAWLAKMPDACQKWWQEQGCDGSGAITVGGDDVQGYFIDCDGCEKCHTTMQELV